MLVKLMGGLLFSIPVFQTDGPFMKEVWSSFSQTLILNATIAIAIPIAFRYNFEANLLPLLFTYHLLFPHIYSKISGPAAVKPRKIKTK